MAWLQRLFGMEKPQDAQVNASASDSQTAPERVGLNGEYDESGLAKRVALAFDQDSNLTDVDTLWVAQTGGTVVLKGTVPSQDILSQMVSVAEGVNGATSVNTDQVTVG
ncbi:BON domain-containing protein [Merismopedia glauca]|uniref:Phospholipid-binding protein n=1 Tax=Merismopedia glauca CCAP 1448/3 TaxID=1296344 RepID=A0A2T1C6F2_9CYAN|nr:BON domain-containing protein [Merismopedia glauca]PSB03855.1 phospholipid-binding protein [Merismopedia glauca CCAP 1448/3]